MPASKAKRAQVAERRLKLIEMRMKGARWDECVTALGYGSIAAACKDLVRALQQRTNDLAITANEYRTLEMEKLDLAERVCHDILATKHYVFQGGELVRGDPDSTGKPKPMIDDAPLLAAVDRLLKIQHRRAKLLDLDLQGSREPLAGQVVTVQIGGVDHSAITG